MDYRDRILADLANQAFKQIARKVVRTLRETTHGMMSGDDSPLRSLWDEICVQVQGNESAYWDVYLDTIAGFIQKEVDKLPVTQEAGHVASDRRGSRLGIRKWRPRDGPVLGGRDRPACAQRHAASNRQQMQQSAN